MKQSIGKAHGSISSDEIEVLEILLQLSPLILESEATCGGFPFTWGCKRRRSAIDVTPSPPPPPPRLRLSSSPTVPSPLRQPTYGGAVVAPSCETRSLPVVKAEASSPATPLSFSPSESDEKPNLLRRNSSLKRKREHYLKIIEELKKDNDLLHGEIKNVKSYFDQLKDFNLRLKARKRELSLGPNQDDLLRQQQQLQFPSEGYASSQPTTSLGVPFSSSGALGMVNSNMGPLGIPDLNVPLEESIPVDSCQPLDVSMANKNLSRAMSAQARQKRIQIYRFKNPSGISKKRYSYR